MFNRILKLIKIAITVTAIAFVGQSPVHAAIKATGTVLLDANNTYTIFKTAERHPLADLEAHCADVHDRLDSGWLKFGHADWEERTATCKVTVTKVAANSAHEAFLEQVDAGTLVIGN